MSKFRVVFLLSIFSSIASAGDFVGSPQRKLTIPLGAIDRCIEGWVLVEHSITSAGEVQDVKVIEYEPSDIFNEEARAFVSKMTFENPKKEAMVGIKQKLTFELTQEQKENCAKDT
jgi:TonB family protein